MATPLLTRVKSKLFVHAHRRSRGLLEGEYASVFHGRSLDYDDLREYVPGDEVRDIDWKATARHGSARSSSATSRPASRTSCSSSTPAAAWPPRRRSGEPKSAVAIIAGRASSATSPSGTATSSASSRATPIDARSPTRRGAGRATSSGCCAPSRRHTTLAAPKSNARATSCEWIVRNVRRRLLLVVVADDHELDGGST